jgi:hypothetical protein
MTISGNVLSAVVLHVFHADDLAWETASLRASELDVSLDGQM